MLDTHEVAGSIPAPPTNITDVRSGDIGNRTFRRHRLHFWPEGVLQGLQSFFLQINITEIVIHKTDQPDSILDFLHTNGLAGEDTLRLIFLLYRQRRPQLAVAAITGVASVMNTKKIDERIGCPDRKSPSGFWFKDAANAT